MTLESSGAFARGRERLSPSPPPEACVRFFDKFVTQGKQGGTGLGTYSARLLAEAQKGSVALEVSDQENSTTITVTLPRVSS